MLQVAVYCIVGNIDENYIKRLFPNKAVVEIILTKGVSSYKSRGHIWSPAVELRDSDN